MANGISEGSVVTLLSGSARMAVGRLSQDDNKQDLAECYRYEVPQPQARGDVRFINIPLNALTMVAHD